MPSNPILRFMNGMHRGLIAVSAGQAGWNVGGMTVLEVTTTGRKSGKDRTVFLTSPIQEGDSMLVVGSRGGDDRHPDWFLNMKEKPEVKINAKDNPDQNMVARITTDEERDRLWPLVIEKYSGYGEYREKTEREIPLIWLDPISGSSDDEDE
jgi:deazaflavin-dependent oxidoreductase (nitroreductase family)